MAKQSAHTAERKLRTKKTEPPQRDSVRWQALVARDARADGTFVYAVTTTGIFCRPVCASKRPKRDNVVFFQTPRAAETAGFRPCKRCNPGQLENGDSWRNRIAEACRTIEAAETPPALAGLAKAAGASPYHFLRRFKATTGLTPKAYAAAVRAMRLRNTLPNAGTVTAAAYESGFSSSAGFYTGAAKALGMKPARYRTGGKGIALRIAIQPSSLGHVLVAATEIGIAAIFLGSDKKTLLRDLEARFPHAERLPADKAFEKLVARVIALVELPLPSDLPLDIQGTAFEHKVWQALQAIPLGETASYAEIAKKIGRPSAARAVARACAANKLAVAVPCHRVIAADGNLAGYRWGKERKHQLLARERAAAARLKNSRAKG